MSRRYTRRGTALLLVLAAGSTLLINRKRK